VNTLVSQRIEQAARMCVEALLQRPSGLFSDFDGTLSEIVPVPDDARFAPGAREALERVAAHVDVAGIITGRAVEDVLARADVHDLHELLVVGNHGLEWLDRGERIDHEAGLAAEQSTREAMARIEARMTALGNTEGVLFEDKRLSASIHYRNAPDPAAVGAQLLPIVKEEAERAHLRVTTGKMLVELRPTAIVSKGTALEQIVLTRHLRGAVFFGDDVTDVDGFRALHQLRDDGVRTVAVGVRSPDVHPDVIANSDIVVEDVSEMIRVMQRIGELLGE